MNQLLIRFYPNSEQVDWLVAHNQTVSASQQSATLSDIPKHPYERITVLIPSTDILLTQVKLPKTTAAQRYQAVPFALENQLGEDIDALHFALGTPHNSHYPVAVIKRQLMRRWSDALAAQQLKPHSFIPDVLCLPVQPNRWTLAIEPHICLLRTAAACGYTLDKENIVDFFALQTSLPEKILVLNATDTKINLKKIDTPIETVTEPLSLLHSALTIKTPAINLLQGKFAKKPNKQTQQRWRTPIKLAIGLVIIYLLTNLAGWLTMRWRYTQLTNRINAIYRQNFPNATAILEPKLRLQRKLAQYHQLQHGSSFLHGLAIIGKILAHHSQIKINSLNFSDNQFSINLQANNFNQLEQFMAQLTHYGLQVNQRAAHKRGKIVRAMILIKG